MIYSRTFIVLILALQIAVAPVCAHPNFGRNREDAQTMAAQAAAQTAFNMDLTSTVKSLDAASLGINRGVNINVGGIIQRVTSQDMLTPAEYLAASQVLATSVQSLRLTTEGTAYKGHFSLPSAVTQSLSNLVIPQGVKFVQDFGSQAALNMAGDLTNSGRFFAFSSNPQVNVGTVNANNIYNQPGAVITSLLAHGDLPTGLNNAVSNLDLVLNAQGQLVNQGLIASSGNLSLNAGGSLVNALASGVQSATVPTLFAANNLNLQSPSIMNQGLMAAQAGNLNALTASLTNSGVMQALAGSMSVQNVVGNTLEINNTNGSMSALTSITFQTLPSVYDTTAEIKPDSDLLNASCTCDVGDQMHEALQELQKVLLSRATLNFRGGDLNAPQIDFTSDHGEIDVHANKIDGVVNVTAYKIYLQSDVGDLTTGTLNLTGDPIFLSKGDLTLNLPWVNGTFWTRGEDFVAYAGGDINMGPRPTYATINTTSVLPCLSFGGKIDIQAGVTFSSSGANASVTGKSESGGNVNMDGVNLTSHRFVNVAANEGAEPGKGIVQVGEVDTELPSCIDAFVPEEETENPAPTPEPSPFSMNDPGNIDFGPIPFPNFIPFPDTPTPTPGGGSASGLNMQARDVRLGGFSGAGQDGTSHNDNVWSIAPPGQNGQNGANGEDGKNGTPYKLISPYEYGTIQIGSIDTHGGDGGHGGHGQDGGNGLPGNPGSKYDIVSLAGMGGTDGDDGDNAGKGGNGGNGGKGGAGGEVTINVKSKALVIASINTSGGTGGNGGFGGKGGNGGDGGDGGNGQLGRSFGIQNGVDVGTQLQALFALHKYERAISEFYSLTTGLGNFENPLSAKILLKKQVNVAQELKLVESTIATTSNFASESKLYTNTLRIIKENFPKLSEEAIKDISDDLLKHIDAKVVKLIESQKLLDAKKLDIQKGLKELGESYMDNRRQDAVGRGFGIFLGDLDNVLGEGYIVGGRGGLGGFGGDGGDGGDGGKSGKGGDGGNAGNISITNTGEVLIPAGILASGGNGGDAGWSGFGGKGGNGGKGGLGGSGGKGATGLEASPFALPFITGSFGPNIDPTDDESTVLSLFAFGGGVPAQDGLVGGGGGAGGLGGQGGFGGKNGDGADGGNGGKGASVQITGSLLSTPLIDVSGGNGGNGGVSIGGFNNGGNGGRGGNGGIGGLGGFAGEGGFAFHGGTGGGGGGGGKAGDGGDGGNGGDGGAGGNAGAGAPGGTVTLNVQRISGKLTIDVNGGISGLGGSGSFGGDGGEGGTGGRGGFGGNGQLGGNNNIPFNYPLFIYILGLVSLPSIVAGGAAIPLFGTSVALSALTPVPMSIVGILCVNWHHGGGSGGDGGDGGIGGDGGTGGNGGLGGRGGNTYQDGATGKIISNFKGIIKSPPPQSLAPYARVGRGQAGGSGGAPGKFGYGVSGGVGGGEGEESFYGLANAIFNFKHPGAEGGRGENGENGELGITNSPSGDGDVKPNPLNPVGFNNNDSDDAGQYIVDTGDDDTFDEISDKGSELDTISMSK